MVDEGLNHASVVNMVTEGVQAAFAKTTQEEQSNQASETNNLRRQVEEMKVLLEQMNFAQ